MIGPFGTYAYAELPAELDNSVPDPFAILLEKPDAQLTFLVELHPYDPYLPGILQAPLPFGTAAFAEPIITIYGGEDVVYLSDLGFTTTPSDSVPNVHFGALVRNPLSFDASILSGDALGLASASYGSLVIHNGDGALDGLEALGWAGRRVVVKAGGRDFPYDSFATVFDGTIVDYEQDDDVVMLTITDNRARTDQFLEVSTYAGTGGKEGGADLEAKPKPLCFGDVANIQPVLVDAANLVYQVHDGSILSVDVVRDAGVALTPGGDVPDITAVTPAAGHFITQLSGGYIKLGSTPAGRITADVLGANDNGYVDTAGAIVLDVLRYRMGARSFGLNDIDIGAFAILGARLPGTCGIYITERTSAASVADALITPCGAYWTFSRLGLVTCGIIEAPDTGDFIIDESLISTEGVSPTQIPPSWRISVAYAPLGVVQDENELAAATTATDRAFLTQPYRFVTNESETARTLNPQATERVFYTQLRTKAAAEALLARLVSIYSVDRRLYRTTIYNALFRTYLGGSVNLTYPRHALASGKPCLVVGVGEDAESGQTNLTLWG